MWTMRIGSYARVVGMRSEQSSGSAVQVSEDGGKSEADEGEVAQQEVIVA